MTTAVVLLSVAYAGVAALLLTLNLATRYAVWVKAAAVVLVTGLYGVSWAAWNGMLGWATPEAVPADFRVLWIAMDEPDKQTREPGNIYLWIRALDEAGLPVGPPRAHRIRWSEEAAETAQAALEALEEGELLNGRLGRNLVGERDAPDDQADYAGDSSVTGAGGDRPQFEFLRVPPPSLPPKSGVM
ncbi:MAG: hypothetical protein AB7I04_16415 [Pseudomonadales bacterium]